MTNIEYVKSRIEYYQYFKEYYTRKTDLITIACAPQSKEIEEKLAIYTSILKILEDYDEGRIG